MKRAELVEQINLKKSYLCVGLDSDSTKIPSFLNDFEDPVFEFNKRIIDATLDCCVSYKINTAFYESRGLKGWETLEKTVNYIPSSHFKIADAKRGDIGNTSSQYAKAFFETLNFDAVTVAPYMGSDSVKPFLEYEGKWTILLGLTSNPGARDFEMLKVGEEFLYEQVFRKAIEWGTENNLMFVVGATQADMFTRIREIVPNHFFLVPGVGFQGGSLQDISDKALIGEIGLLVNVSRAVIFASEKEDFDKESGIIARKYQTEMSAYFI